MIEDVVARHVVGREPFHIEATWRDVYTAGYGGGPDPTLAGVLSGIEMAMWDIAGKAVGKPVHELLGGRVRERLRSYSYIYSESGDATDVYLDPDLAATRAAEYAALGFTALKFDPAGAYTSFDPHQPSLADLDRCERYVAQIREAVGSRCDLLFGTHGQFTVSGAIRLARRLSASTALVRGADAAGGAGGDGARRARDVDPDRDRRAADHEVRVRAGARDRRRVHPADEHRPGRRAARGEEDRGDGGVPLRADRPAPLLRARRRRRQHPARPVHAELPDPRGDRALGRGSTPSC